MLKFFLNKISRLEKYANRIWYLPLLSLLAALDLFVLVIPTDGICASASMIQPRRWLKIATTVTFGSSLGSLFLATLAFRHGNWVMEHILRTSTQSTAWQQTEIFMNNYGSWALGIIAVSPFPQQPAVVIGGMTHMPLGLIFLSVFVGRGVKYFFFAWAASHAPRLLMKFTGLRKELGQIESENIDGSDPKVVRDEKQEKFESHGKKSP